jgi:hypothetical protein
LCEVVTSKSTENTFSFTFSIPFSTIQLLQFKPKNAQNCITFAITLQNPLTATCCGPYWATTREYNNILPDDGPISIETCSRSWLL